MLFVALIVPFVLMAPVEGHARADVPLESTPGAAGHLAARVGAMTQSLAPRIGIPPDVVDGLRACSGLEARLSACSLEGASACRDALIALYRTTAVPAQQDPLSRAHAFVLAATAADATLRLASVEAALLGGECGRAAPEPATGVQVTLLPDRRTLHVRPSVPLRGGRRWALVAFGLAPAELAHVREAVVPRPRPGGLEVPEGSLAGPIASLGEYAGPIHLDTAIGVVRRLEREIELLPAVSGAAGVQIQLPEPLTAEQLRRMRLAFVPARQAADETTVVVMPVLDGRVALRAHRDRLRRLGCVETPAEPVDAAPILGPDAEAVRLVLRGMYRSLDIRGGPAAPLGAASEDARPVELAYLLALPKGYGPETPLVLGVHGYAGDARRMLRRHATELARAGLGLLAIDLPEHGERGGAPERFVEVLNPAVVGVDLRQSVVDVLAAVHAALDCGIVLPDGVRLRPAELRYAGYSLGAMVGVMARSVEPGLGTAAFFAPGGDVPGWLMQYVMAGLEAPLVTCVGGTDHGRDCFKTGLCAGGGLCAGDPFLFHVAAALGLPYRLVLAGSDPLEYARQRTGPATHARALLLTGGQDKILHPILQNRLADAYDMHAVDESDFRGPRTRRIHWPDLAHGLVERDQARVVGNQFLATRGRSVDPTPEKGPSPVP